MEKTQQQIKSDLNAIARKYLAMENNDENAHAAALEMADALGYEVVEEEYAE
ncbi:hypothetical protein [Sporosarcina phage Lietuvens]|nr:hypothetical protein [Sporosarcina phage Lietuvens]